MTIEHDLDVDRTRPFRTEALNLTHNAPASLHRCLSAVGSQTRPPTAILVLDNASDPPVDLAAPTSELQSVYSAHRRILDLQAAG